MKLPESERGALAVRLLDSVGKPEDEVGEPEDEVARAWLEEARRRLTDIQEGREETVPWEDVRRDLFEAS
jgi:putative addiction module component (TIGR02574 family)